jgi:hypothetical protein
MTEVVKVQYRDDSFVTNKLEADSDKPTTYYIYFIILLTKRQGHLFIYQSTTDDHQCRSINSFVEYVE